MPRGGARLGAGRPYGSRNRVTLELVKAVQRDGLTPLEFLLKVMRDESLETSQRLEAAKLACPYIHPKMVAISVNQEIVHETVRHVSNDRVREILEELIDDVVDAHGNNVKIVA